MRPIISLVRFERVHMSNPLRDATKKKAPKTESGAEASVEMDIPRLIGVKCRESGGEARDASTPVMSRSSFSLPRKVRQRGWTATIQRRHVIYIVGELLRREPRELFQSFSRDYLLQVFCLVRMWRFLAETVFDKHVQLHIKLAIGRMSNCKWRQRILSLNLVVDFSSTHLRNKSWTPVILCAPTLQPLWHKNRHWPDHSWRAVY